MPKQKDTAFFSLFHGYSVVLKSLVTAASRKFCDFSYFDVRYMRLQ